MATLRKKALKEGYVYVVDFRFQGERHVISTGTDNKQLAARVLNEIEGKVIRGVFKITDYEKKDIRLSEFIKEYFQSIEGTKMASTIYGERIYTRKLLNIIGDIYLGTINLKVAEYWRSELLKQVNPVTCNIELRVIKVLFNKAVEHGYILENPFKKLKKLKVGEKRLYLNSDEIKRLMIVLDDNIKNASNKQRHLIHYKFKLLCEVLLNTGMRREEVISLTSEQIDFNRNIIVVERTKSKRIREIPMTNRVREIFVELGPGLFSGLTSNRASHKFTIAAKKIGLKNMKLHSLRHTFATMLIALGFDIKVVKDLLGHEDIRITEIYAKAGSHIMRQAMNSFDKFQRDGYDLVTPTQPKLLESEKVVKT